MKALLLIVFSVVSFVSYAQETNDSYNSSLADSLGADDYGMKSYTLVMLKTGEATIEDKNVRDSLFRGHMANIEHLVAIDKLIVAGPLQKNEKTYRGIFILTVTDPKEVEELLMMDPAIKEGLLAYEMYGWYGAAALPAYLEVQNKITKIKP